MKRSHDTNDDPSKTPIKRSTINKMVLNSLHVTPIERYCGKCPYFRQPTEVGCFSLDGERNFHNDSHRLRYYKPPISSHNMEFDLRKGYDTFIEKDDDVKERLTHLLRWIQCNRHKFVANKQANDGNLQDKSLNTDFVSWRGHFTKFLCTPYEMREPWKMAATRFNGTIFLSEIETEKSKNDRTNRSARHKEMCYWGFKFEDYTTEPIQAKEDECQASEDGNVNNNEAYCTIVRTRINAHSILIGAEVDCCIKNDKSRPPNNYIELKTTRLMNNHKQHANFARYKLLKFWGQSFLAGIPKIIVGMRNDDGIVSRIKSYDTLTIPNICKQYPNQWDASICMNFLDALLSWLKEVVIHEGPETVYIVNFEHPYETITVEVIEDGSERFLPNWFVGG